MAIIKCPECNSDISDTCKQCIHCGYKFKPARRTSSKQAETGENIPHKKRNLGKVILLCCAILVVISALVVFLVTGRNNKDIFKPLYDTPTREEVYELFGSPDRTWGYDGMIRDAYYENFEYLGATGTFHVGFTGDCADSASFSVDWELSDPLYKKELKQFGEDVDEFYTKLYGERVEGESSSTDYPGCWKPTRSDKITVATVYSNVRDTVSFLIILNN